MTADTVAEIPTSTTEITKKERAKDWRSFSLFRLYEYIHITRMIDNPILQHKQFYSQFAVVYVVKSTDARIDPFVKNFCKNEGIPYMMREFNGRSYYEDCEYIHRLPSVHLFYKDAYQGTYSEDPVTSIEHQIKIIKEEEEMRALKGNSKWYRRLNFFTRWVFPL